MSVFVIADTHLSFSADKPMNVFKGWDDYVSRLEKNWQKIVSPGDTVVIPGDISWAMSLEQARADFAFLNALNGSKIILKGNHDYWWNTVSKMEAFVKKEGFNTISFLHNNAQKAGGFALCGSRGWPFDDDSAEGLKILSRECGRLQRSLQSASKLGGEPVVFLHYPPVGYDRYCEPIIKILKDYGVKRCFYGHLHAGAAKAAFNGEKEGIKFKLISADYLQFCPLLIV